MSANEDGAGVEPPWWLFWLELAYLVALVVMLLTYLHSKSFQQLVPSPIGPVPLEVPWWGAIGGVTISLTGIFRNASCWKSAYNRWHIARPALGAVVGTVGYLVFVAVIRSTGTSITPDSPNAVVVFSVVAFLVGYREQIFRELLKRAADTLFAPGTQKRSGDSGE